MTDLIALLLGLFDDLKFWKNKKVFIRADLNVPIKSGKITSSQRIKSSLATINYCLNVGAKVMVTSHLGRPKEGEYNPEFSLEPVVKFLENHLNKKINFIVVD